MKRRLSNIALTLTFSAALTACGSSTSTSEVTTPEVTTAEVTTAETRPVAAAPDTKAPDTKVAASDDGAVTKDERAAMLKSVKSGGAADDIANCVVDGLAKGLTREEFNSVTKAEKESDVPAAVAEKANSIALDCALAASGGTPGASTEAPAVPETAAPETTAPETTVAKVTQTVGTKDSPVKLASSAMLDNGYGVTVNTYTSDATAAIAAANEYNDKPTAGMRYVLVNLTMLNDGGDTDKRIPGYDLILKAVSASGKSYENSDCSVVTPEPLDRFVDLFKGKSTTGNVCFLVDDADAADLTMYVDVFTADYNTITYYFSLAS